MKNLAKDFDFIGGVNVKSDDLGFDTTIDNVYCLVMGKADDIHDNLYCKIILDQNGYIILKSQNEENDEERNNTQSLKLYKLEDDFELFSVSEVSSQFIEIIKNDYENIKKCFNENNMELDDDISNIENIHSDISISIEEDYYSIFSDIYEYIEEKYTEKLSNIILNLPSKEQLHILKEYIDTVLWKFNKDYETEISTLLSGDKYAVLSNICERLLDENYENNAKNEPFHLLNAKVLGIPAVLNIVDKYAKTSWIYTAYGDDIGYLEEDISELKFASNTDEDDDTNDDTN